jgi:hypothetical protein
MYVYLGRIIGPRGEGYYWAIPGRDGFYFYSRTREDRWATKYVGKIGWRELERLAGRAAALVAKVLLDSIDVVRDGVMCLLRRLSGGRARAAFAETYRDLLDVLELPADDDG